MKNSKFDKNSMKQLFKEIKTVCELNHTLNVFVVRTELKEMKPGIKNHFNDDDLNFIPLTKKSSKCPKVMSKVKNEWKTSSNMYQLSKKKNNKNKYNYKIEPKEEYEFNIQDYEKATTMNKFPWIHITKKMNAAKKRYIQEEIYDLFLKLILNAEDFKNYIIYEKPMDDKTFLERKNSKIDSISGFIPCFKNKLTTETELTLDNFGTSTGGSSLNTVMVSLGEFAVNYCYCKKECGLGSLLVGCENADKCPNGGWYHRKCVAELRNKTNEEIEKLPWFCPECKPKSEDSIFNDIGSSEFSTHKNNDKNNDTYAFDLTKDNIIEQVQCSSDDSMLDSEDISSDPESDDSYDADLQLNQDSNHSKDDKPYSPISKVSSPLSGD